jgi:hypothetical protein
MIAPNRVRNLYYEYTDVTLFQCNRVTVSVSRETNNFMLYDEAEFAPAGVGQPGQSPQSRAFLAIYSSCL